jgi:Ca2+-binding EF-hand superfamily protein
MREAQGASELTFEDLAEAYPDAPEEYLTRMMWRYDIDNSGTLEIGEIEQLLSQNLDELNNLEKIEILESRVHKMKEKLKKMLGHSVRQSVVVK